MKCSNSLKMILCIVTALFAAACADIPSPNNSIGGSSGDVATASYQYDGPGSAYTIDLDEVEETFGIGIADSLSDPLHTIVYGTFERFDNGFIELTVTEATGTMAPAVDDVAIAIEAPGFGVVLRPFGGAAEFVPSLVLPDSCTSGDFDANWILTSCNDGGPSCDATSSAIGFFGSFNYDASAESGSFSESYDIDTATDLGPRVVATTSCSYGILETSDTAIYLNDDGGAIVHESTDDSADTRHAFALPKQAIVQADLAGDYYGLAFDKSDGSGTPLYMGIAVGGASATIYELDEGELEAATQVAVYGTIAITSVNQIGATSSDGWITATFTEDGGPTRPLYCTAAPDLGDPLDTVVLCVGQSAAVDQEFLNFMFVSDF
jgi:hypothetical protein